MSETMMTPVTTTPLLVQLSDELLARLELVAPGPPYRYRFKRDLLQRLSETVFTFDQLAELYLWRSIQVEVDVVRDRPWLPLLTHRTLPGPAGTPTTTVDHAKEEMIERITSALRNYGTPAKEAARVASESYQEGRDFDELIKFAFRSMGRTLE